MKHVKLLSVKLGIVAMLIAQSVVGAGFGIYEGSTRGNALGSEVTADPASPSVLYNNAAGITELDGRQMEFGSSFVYPQQAVTTTMSDGQNVNYTAGKWWMIPNTYVTRQINDRVWTGVGMFTRYGLGVKYKDDWAGRYNVQEVTITSLDLNPSVAFKATDRLSLAAGIRAEYFDFELYKAIPTATPFVDPDLQMHLKGESWGVGFNLGAYFKASDWISFGLAYDSQVKQTLNGNYTTTHPVLARGDASGDITTPAIIRLGASVKATENLTVNAGVAYTMWSSYDELAIDFNPSLLGEVPRSVTEKDWNDVFRYQLGVEYAFNQTWTLRTGYIYDCTPDPDGHVDYIVPANNRNMFATGVGYQKGNFFSDLSYTYLLIEDRHVAARPEEGIVPSSFEGGDAHMIAASFGYKL